MKKNLSVPILLIGFFLASPAFAAPSVSGVSGTVFTGGSVTVSGSGFGTKSTATPFKYDSFENGIVGQPVSGWSQNNNNSVTYSAAYSRGQSSKVAHHDATSGNYNMSLGMDSDFSGQTYVDFWMRVDTLDGTINPSRNFKPWRIYGSGGGDPQVDYVIGGDGVSMTNLCDGSCSTSWSGDNEKQSQWRHFQIVLKESSSAGSSDGTYRHWIDGKAFGHDSASVVTRNGNVHYGEIRIGHYWAFDSPTNSGAHIYTDDIYIDKSWSRIELGNAQTYAASTHREIQIPTAWSTNSVTLSVNQGSFTSGSQAYLYVVDSTGAVNASGYPVTIGGGGTDIIAPSAPSGFSVR